jgi:hypothetical protein
VLVLRDLSPKHRLDVAAPYFIAIGIGLTANALWWSSDRLWAAYVILPGAMLLGTLGRPARFIDRRLLMPNPPFSGAVVRRSQIWVIGLAAVPVFVIGFMHG